MFTILTDTSANLDCALLRERGIGVIPFTFTIDGEEQSCTDTAAFDGRAFYDAMRAGKRVTTSQITPQRYVDTFRPLLEAGEEVLFVGMSSGISGSYDSARMAKAQLLEEFPRGRLALVDTLGASLGEGLLVLRAADLRDGGASLEEAEAALLALRRGMKQVFTVEDLNYLRATGRLSNFKAAVATVLNIKPLLRGDEAGRIICFAKVRGRRRSIEALAERYEAMVREAGSQTVGIAHADCPEDAALLGELLRRRFPPRELMTVCYEPVTGSHVGPGTLALFFFGAEAETERAAHPMGKTARAV